MGLRAWILLAEGLAVVVIAARLLDHLCLWLESRGLLYYRHKKPSGGGSSVLMPFQELLHPEIKHVYRIREEKRQDEDTPGGPRG